MSKKPVEYVMAIERTIFEKIGIFQGVKFEIEKYLELFYKQHRYMLRSEVETNYDYKQIIPYAILTFKNTILSYLRGKLLTEDRLKGRFSIGVGGHVSIEDQNLFQISFEEAMHREINEEVEIGCPYEANAVALINDDSNDVGRVHVGIVYSIHLDEAKVKKKEKSINELEFKTIDQLSEDIHLYENWSQICIRNVHSII